MIKKILELKLKILAKWTLARYRPKIIAITGSVGKTSTKNSVHRVLSSSFSVRKSFKSYNNQIGVPLTILGFTTPGKNLWGWFKILWLGFFRIIYQSKYPEILVLEMGTDRVGDINYLTSIARPEVAVLTGIGLSHLEHFKTKEALIKEKESLVTALPEDGKAVLNFDDPISRQIGLKSKKEVVFVGLKEGANLEAQEIQFSKEGMSFKVEQAGNSVPVKIKALGRSQIYNSLFALAVGSIFNLDLIQMAKSLQDFKGEKGRNRLLKGKQGTLIIDDSYNSAPESAKVALEILDEIGAGRKVAILGDMLELGEESAEEHFLIGKLAAQKAEKIILVGPEAKEMKRGAESVGKDDLSWYPNRQKLDQEILKKIKKDDTILIKASQGIRLDKTVEKLLSDDLDPSQELVRRSNEWE